MHKCRRKKEKKKSVCREKEIPSLCLYKTEKKGRTPPPQPRKVWHKVPAQGRGPRLFKQLSKKKGFPLLWRGEKERAALRGNLQREPAFFWKHKKKERLPSRPAKGRGLLSEKGGERKRGLGRHVKAWPCCARSSPGGETAFSVLSNVKKEKDVDYNSRRKEGRNGRAARSSSRVTPFTIAQKPCSIL